MSEGDIQREILVRLALMPEVVYAWRQSVGARRYKRMGIAGQGDISGMLKGGRRLEIEVKTDKGIVSEDQIKFGARINAMGGLWFIARSADEAIAKVKEALV